MSARPNSAEVYEWFRKNKKALLANDYTSELSCARANEIVQGYADVMASGAHGRIPDASLLPYAKETILAAIDRSIECLIEKNGGHDVPPTSELEDKINTLGAVKCYLSEFQDIDTEDQQAVAMLNSCRELVQPRSIEDIRRGGCGAALWEKRKIVF